MDADHIDPEDKDEYERNQHKTFAEHIAHLNSALTRIASFEAFYDQKAICYPEAHARMFYAQCILDGFSLEEAAEKAKAETLKGYPRNKPI